jgi:hypothetical protein
VPTGWLPFLDVHPRGAVSCGRRRARFPDASVYNRVCEIKWDTPMGRAQACGGNSMMWMEALDAVGGFARALIAQADRQTALIE